jgi:predicted CXXCH cytochrome family protein
MRGWPAQSASRPIAGGLAFALLCAACRQEGEAPLSDAPIAASAPASSPASPGPNAADGVAPATSPVPSTQAAPKPVAALPPGAGCVSAECHAGFASAPQIHGPLSAGDCSSCHEEDTGGHIYPLNREGDALCTFCHAVTGSRAKPHRALTQGGCLACHRPHVAETKYLLAADSIASLCSHCHPPEVRKHAHGPYAEGECTTCHDPHESNAEDLLRGGEGPAHCFLCHSETRLAAANAPYVHSPAAENCLTCHSPHTSDFSHQLNAPTDQLCFRCHGNLEEQIRGAETPHGAVFTAERCANCHDPHAAGRPRLLHDRLDRLCLQCHDKPIGSNDGRLIPDMRPSLTQRKFLHGPVESGDCTACHNVHGAGHSRLLKAKFPASFYASFDMENYALCFQCHEPGLVLEERTAALTGFRDGDLNLHYLHVNRQGKGRTCKACHAIHGSDLPLHMATEVPFEGSQWAMPIQFVKSPQGGSCAPGCHQPVSYDRERSPGPAAEPKTGGAP